MNPYFQLQWDLSVQCVELSWESVCDVWKENYLQFNLGGSFGYSLIPLFKVFPSISPFSFINIWARNIQVVLIVKQKAEKSKLKMK